MISSLNAECTLIAEVVLRTFTFLVTQRDKQSRRTTVTFADHIVLMKGYYFYIAIILVVALYYGSRHFYFKPKYVNGEGAPQFTAQLINGESFSLSDLKGSYVLLDFWGSWCGPCRRQNPRVVELYQKFGSQTFKDADGFVIVGIGIEFSERSWKNAIQQDGLAWKYHIGQFDKFNSPIAKLYGVREIPTKYLINPQGDIIGVNLTFTQIEKLLQDRTLSMRE